MKNFKKIFAVLLALTLVVTCFAACGGDKKNDAKEGNGLGLAIVKQIMELHKGTIEVQSGKESTDFILTL